MTYDEDWAISLEYLFRDDGTIDQDTLKQILVRLITENADQERIIRRLKEKLNMEDFD